MLPALTTSQPELNHMCLRDYLAASVVILEKLSTSSGVARVEQAIATTADAISAGRVLLTCGNGGSASDSMHIAGELVGRFLIERKPIKCICLASNPVILTAWSNDYSYESVFARQVEAYGEPGGILLGLSTSGNSRNVVSAFQQARNIGMITIGFTGEGGGAMAQFTDILVDVPSRHTPEIQQAHIHLYHYFCQMIEDRLFGPGRAL